MPHDGCGSMQSMSSIPHHPHADAMMSILERGTIATILRGKLLGLLLCLTAWLFRRAASREHTQL